MLSGLCHVTWKEKEWQTKKQANKYQPQFPVCLCSSLFGFLWIGFHPIATWKIFFNFYLIFMFFNPMDIFPPNRHLHRCLSGKQCNSLNPLKMPVALLFLTRLLPLWLMVAITSTHILFGWRSRSIRKLYCPPHCGPPPSACRRCKAGGPQGWPSAPAPHTLSLFGWECTEWLSPGRKPRRVEAHS